MRRVRNRSNRGSDICDLNEKGDHLVDWIDRLVTKSVCDTARWFDSFFGTPEEFADRYASFGRLGLGGFWDEDDGFDPETRFRAKISLPAMSEKLQAVAGRGNLDSLLDDDEVSSIDEQFLDQSNDWLLGFDYRVNFGAQLRFSPSAGVTWEGGVDPYARLRFLYQVPFHGRRSQYRLRFTPQWQLSKGLGYVFRVSLDHTLAERTMLRWDVSYKDFQKKFDGLSYSTHLNLFHQLNRRNAIRCKVGVVSQTRLEHQPQDALATVSWRTTVYRETLTVESLVGTSYRRRPGEPEREPELLLGLVFELKFGR